MGADISRSNRQPLALPGQSPSAVSTQKPAHGSLSTSFATTESESTRSTNEERKRLVIHTGVTAANQSRAEAWSAHLANFLHQHQDKTPEQALGVAAQKLGSKFSADDLRGVYTACGSEPKLALLKDVLSLAMQSTSIKRAA